MAQAVTPYGVPDWLPSDTEESVVGTQWHQQAIGALADLLREVARRRGASWGVCEQVALRGLHYASGHAYDPRPDVMVLPQPLPSGNDSSIHLDQAGAPLFVAEVASDSTVGNDIGEKRHAYASAGVAEYVVFDPGGDLLSAPVLAWRLVAGVYQPLQPEADGWWRSRALDVTFRDARPYLLLRDRDGQPVELSHEIRQRAREQEERLRMAEERLRDTEARLRAAEERLAEDARQRTTLEDELRRLHAAGPDASQHQAG